MDATPSGDPAPQLTRGDVDRLHAVMVGHELDWASRCALLASTLESAIAHLAPGRDYDRFRSVANEYHRDVTQWLNASDAYWRALGGPISDVLPLEDG